MATEIRPEISEKSKYWISKHRYYELKHFCLRYEELREEYENLQSATLPSWMHSPNGHRKFGDPTANAGIRAADLKHQLDTITSCARESDSELATYIFIAVTKGLSYETLRVNLGIPAGKDMYYDRYRKFFWLLDKKRK